MDDEASDTPALDARGVMLIDELSRATGLDRQTADALVTDRMVEGLHHTDGRVFGIFDDALPTNEELRSLGLTARDDYDPELHRSYVSTDDDPDPANGEDEADDESDKGPCRGVTPSLDGRSGNQDFRHRGPTGNC